MRRLIANIGTAAIGLSLISLAGCGTDGPTSATPPPRTTPSADRYVDCVFSVKLDGRRYFESGRWESRYVKGSRRLAKEQDCDGRDGRAVAVYEIPNVDPQFGLYVQPPDGPSSLLLVEGVDRGDVEKMSG